MLYSSVENKKIKELKKLHTKKHRDLNNKFLIEGEHLILEADKYGYLEEVLVCEKDIKVNSIKNEMTHQVAKTLTQLDTPSNIIGVCRKVPQNKIKDKVLYLDGIQDPGNLGTIIRSCVAFDIDTLILSPDCVDLYNSKVIRATQGLIFKLNIIIEENSVLNELKKTHKIIGTKVNGGKSIKELEKVSKFVIIMGNEGKGMSKECENKCDELIFIDMNQDCESLNVGVATSIILYEMRD